MLVLSLVYLWSILGVAVLGASPHTVQADTAAGIAAICLLLPLKVLQERLAGKYETCWREASDERLSLVSSVFPGIRLIVRRLLFSELTQAQKLLNWQHHFGEKMRVLRANELVSLRLRLFSMALGNVVLFGLPILVALASFLVRTQALGLPLDSATAFSALSVFGMVCPGAPGNR